MKTHLILCQAQRKALSLALWIVACCVPFFCLHAPDIHAQNPQENVKKVYVVFKTHLDVGFTDLSSTVTDRYLHEFIPKALSVSEQLEADGSGETVKDAWKNTVRRLADAFVATWKNEGTWGNYIDINDGRVAVYNTSSGAMAIGGLALASVYFQEP